MGTVQVTPRDVIFSKIDIEKTQKTNDFADSEFKLEHAKRLLEPLSFEEHRYFRNPSCRLEYDYLSFSQNQNSKEQEFVQLDKPETKISSHNTREKISTEDYY